MKKINELTGLENIDDKYYVTTCGKILIIDENNKYKILHPHLDNGYRRINLYQKMMLEE